MAIVPSVRIEKVLEITL